MSAVTDSWQQAAAGICAQIGDTPLVRLARLPGEALTRRGIVVLGKKN